MTAGVTKRRGVRITVLLITTIASLVVLSTGLVLFLSSKAAFKNTFELLRESATLTMEGVEADVRGHLSPSKHIVSHLTALVEQGHVDPADREQLIIAMKGAMAGSPQIAGLVLWDQEDTDIRVLRQPDGQIIQTPGEKITEQEFLENIAQVRKTGKPLWREPAYSRGETYVYVAGPLAAKGDFWGVLVTGVAISELSSFVDKVGRDLGMTAFILYGDDHVLAHRELKDADPDALFSFEKPLLPLSELNDAVLRGFNSAEIELDHEIENASIRELEIADERHFIMSRRIDSFGDVPWHIGVHAPLDDLDDQIRRLVGSIFAGLGVLGLAVALAILLARYIARPIHTISAAAERIGRFELTDISRVRRSRIKELDEQAVAFNRMLDGLRWFETYVPKSLVSRLIAGGGTVPSGEMEVTVMFTDIIGFTAMSETMEPHDVAEMLNEHFEAIGQCIEEEAGTLDKYIGDAVMAFWGAPERQSDHAARACRAALKIAEAVAQQAASARGHPPIRLKIALHTGRLLVGNIGARSRMNYTVIGDTVNTCSRIEGLARDFDNGDGSVILVSGDTAEQATEEPGLRFENVGAFSVKGRREQVRVCRLSEAR